ncbi:hexokinase [Coemansia sp. RSA 2424]|nr:hexokinase [Coemansia sp. RSA 2424]
MSACALSDRQRAKLSQIEQEFAVSTDQLQAIVKRIHVELSLGLKSDSVSSLRMSPSFVHQRTTPSGTALGMGIEASGRRIRITSAQFSSDDSSVSHTSTQVFVAPPAVTRSKSISAFFEYTAFCLREFIQAQGLDHQTLPLGITIGLPISGEASINEQSKEDSLDLCGKNVARRLCDTFLRGRLPVRVTSVTNSVVSTLVAARHENKTTRIAASFNRGINAAYFERLANVELLNQPTATLDNALVAIDTEIGRFSSSALPLTQWDHRVDRESKHPGARAFEKLVADQYLGEIVRNLITDLMDERLLFALRTDAKTISTEYSFHTAYMAPIIESEEAAAAILENEFGMATSEADRQIVRALCEIVANRSALLAGAMLAALVLKTRTGDGAPPAVALSGVLFDVNQKLASDAVNTMQSLLAHKSSAVEVRFQRRGSEGLGAAINAASI